MAAYHVKGNTIHSGLHIDINREKLTPLTSSELNRLRSKYLQSKVLFYDEISMVGRQLWNKADQKLKEIFGTKKDFGGLHVIAAGDGTFRWYLSGIVMYSKMMREDMDLLQQIYGQNICKCTH